MDNYQFDPAENTWVHHLKRVQDAPVSTNVPPERPPRFIQVERTGGVRTASSDHAQMTFTCWAESRADAAALASEVLHIVLAARVADGRPVNKLRVLGEPMYSPDGESGADRYIFTITAALRGSYRMPPTSRASFERS